MELEFESTGAAEISLFHKLLLVNGTKPFRLAVCPVDITLQARLLPPVPPVEPLFPPVFPAGCDTPAQAVKKSAKAKGAVTETYSLETDQEQRIIKPLSVSRGVPRKRTSGHVRMPGRQRNCTDSTLALFHLFISAVLFRPSYFAFRTDLAAPIFSYLSYTRTTTTCSAEESLPGSISDLKS